MARQSTTPVPFQRTQRPDTGTLYSSGRAGVSVMCAVIPVLAGDSASGRVSLAGLLAEMPKPLRNSVVATAQAWFWPKTCDPRFASHEEFIASRQQKPIKRLGQADAAPLPFYRGIAPNNAEMLASDHVKTLGLHFPVGNLSVNVDIFDAYQSIWNFRAAAHSSHLELRDFYPASGSAPADYWKFARAFWPQNRFSGVVADYEAALVQGQLALDVAAGQLPVSGLGILAIDGPAASSDYYDATRSGKKTDSGYNVADVPGGGKATMFVKTGNRAMTGGPAAGRIPEIFAEMGGQRVITSLADLEKARTTQAFAKMRTAYAGNAISDYDNESAIVAELMQGLSVPQDAFRRPWLLDSKIVEAGMVERHATDGASLDQSVTRGMFSTQLSINLPKQDIGGYIVVTMEVVPQRLYERQGDHGVMFSPSNPTIHLPDALRDVQNPLPVDRVLAWRIDAKHSNVGALYGFEPMNDKWRRSFTRLGGDFYQATPASPWTEARSALWMPEIVNPQFSRDHYLVPSPFPHDVFSDTAGSAFEFQCDHNITFSGLTQFGDVLVEDNNEWADTEAAQ